MRTEEHELGFDESSGRVVVDVLSLLPGGPILQRILMWPEHLQRRPFQLGDGVKLRDLESDASLNEAAGVVEAEGFLSCIFMGSAAWACYAGAFCSGPEAWKYIVALEDGRRLEVRWRNLLLTSSCA